MARLLRDERVDPNVTDWYGRTPLMFAAGLNNHLVVDLLLCHELIDTNAVTLKNGTTALIWATENGSVTALVRLLKDKRVDVNVVTKCGLTCLDMAYHKLADRPVVQEKVVELLQAAGAVRGHLVANLFRASSGANIHECKALIASRCDVNARSASGHNILTEAAASTGTTASHMRQLFELPGINPALCCSQGLNSLHHAAQAGNVEVTEVAVMFIDPLSLSLDGRTALLIASQRICNNTNEEKAQLQICQILARRDPAVLEQTASRFSESVQALLHGSLNPRIRTWVKSVHAKLGQWV